MKRKLYFAILLSFLCFISGKSQTVDATTTVTWPFDLGTAGQLANFSEGTADYFSLNFVSVGSNLAYKDFNTTYSITYTRFQPAEQLGSASPEGMVGFNIRPKTGLKFMPTTISFDCMRFGTDGGFIDVVWKSADGTKTTLETGLKPARNNSGAGTHATYDLSALSIPESDGECTLELYIYSLGNTKQVGLANIVVEGKIKGTIVDVTTYTLATSVSPSGAGSIATFPVGNEFDAGTEITLTANRNFGYNFSHWANESDETVSTDNPYSFSLNENVTLKAVYTAINTYSLAINVEGGAKTYMVTASPAGTMVGDQRMYEEGTNVTLTASSNPIVSFTNWGTGETSSDLSVTMSGNQNITAIFSAIDYVVGWDFYVSGNNGRVADFFSNSDNESASLILRNAEGTVKGWLDKSQISAGGYEGQPAAVNWNPIADKYYYQISFNAKDFTDINVSASMLLNYNAYSVQKCEYSLDGETFTQLGTITMTAPKVWYNGPFTLPADANHAEKVYIRWIPDYTSDLVGATATNDGTAISGIYVTGTATIFNDGTAPVLSSSVPANDGTDASATGKIVLTFDEKVKIADGTTATLGLKTLSPTVSGKTITFAYSGLDYNTLYTFSLAGNKVSDLADNTLTSPITINFTTLDRPTVTRKSFDFIVGVDGDFKAALQAAQNASSSGNRFYIFFPNGEYNIGENTGDGNQMTSISIPNVSYIGESSAGVVIYNKSIQESINSTATMYFTGNSSNNYLQDISLMNKMDYRTGSLKGRGVALWDQGNKSIYKNVKLLSNQDTYYSGNIRSYFETSEIHGTVDFICGGGDIFFNECLIYLEDRAGNVITAPATSSDWGYVFNSCTIDGFPVNSSSYRLGRPWSNAPKAVYLNTTMNLLPAASGWGDPMNVVPAVFAEYNSMTSSGSTVDLSSRRTTYTKDAITVTLEPVLTAEQAAQYTLENVLGGNDAWQPTLYTEQAAAPVLSGEGKIVSWDDSNYVLCWAVCKNGSFVEFVTSNTYTIPDDVTSGTVYTIRAANAMGGLGIASNEYNYNVTGIDDLRQSAVVVGHRYYTINGKLLQSPKQAKGIVIVQTIYSDGHITTSKVVNIER